MLYIVGVRKLSNDGAWGRKFKLVSLHWNRDKIVQYIPFSSISQNGNWKYVGPFFSIVGLRILENETKKVMFV